MDVYTARRVMTDTQRDQLVATKVGVHTPTPLGPPPYYLLDEDTGATLAYVTTAPADLARACVSAFRAIPRTCVVRAAGVRTRSNTFGYSAPKPMFQINAATTSGWAMTDPTGHTTLETFAHWAWAEFQTNGPAPAVDHMRGVRDHIHTDWRMGDTPWTSGIANDTVPLYYHYDRNNVPDAWSVMLGARAGVRGGHLHIADYDVTLPINDRDVVFFPGVNYMHGVTPLRESMRDGFRYTFVWYPVKAFYDLGSAEEARTAARVRRTELEDDLLIRQRASGLIP